MHSKLAITWFVFVLSACGGPEANTISADGQALESIAPSAAASAAESGEDRYCAQLPDTGGKGSMRTDGICTTHKETDASAVVVVILPTPAARYRITFDALWTAADFPTNYPGNAHFSRIVGTAHNEQVVFWEVEGQPASIGIESMAETGSTSALGDEIAAAQGNGYSVGVIKGSGIGNGDGEVNIEFDVSIDYPLVSFVSMVAPSPDWFVGISGFSLLDDEGYWTIQEEIPLKVYDAGTDLGVQPTSANQDSSADSLPITLLSSDRADTDFENGVHFQTSKIIGKFIIEKVEP